VKRAKNIDFAAVTAMTLASIIMPRWIRWNNVWFLTLFWSINSNTCIGNRHLSTFHLWPSQALLLRDRTMRSLPGIQRLPQRSKLLQHVEKCRLSNVLRCSPRTRYSSRIHYHHSRRTTATSVWLEGHSFLTGCNRSSSVFWHGYYCMSQYCLSCRIPLTSTPGLSFRPQRTLLPRLATGHLLDPLYHILDTSPGNRSRHMHSRLRSSRRRRLRIDSW
jgi:hypothetical protein